MHALRFTGTLPAEQLEAKAEKMTWYHSLAFDNGARIRGWWNVADTVTAIGFPDVRGMRVLDIGPASGYFSFLFHQQGAEVTALELVDANGFNTFASNPLIDNIRKGATFNESCFSFLNREMGEPIRYLNGAIYDVGTNVLRNEQFDLVFVGSLLIHLRDPVGALMAARSVCSGSIIATTVGWAEKFDDPVAMMKWARPTKGSIDWWLPNRAALAAWFEASGFREVSVGGRFLQHADAPRPHPSGTLATEPLVLYPVSARA